MKRTVSNHTDRHIPNNIHICVRGTQISEKYSPTKYVPTSTPMDTSLCLIFPSCPLWGSVLKYTIMHQITGHQYLYYTFVFCHSYVPLTIICVWKKVHLGTYLYTTSQRNNLQLKAQTCTQPLQAYCYFAPTHTACYSTPMAYHPEKYPLRFSVNLY